MSLRILLLALLFTTTLQAKSIRFVPVTERVARADTVVIGTVVEIDPDPVEIDVFSNGQKTWHHVAKVKIGEALLGGAGLTEVRVAFVGQDDQPVDGLNIPTPVLEKGNEVVLFLRHRQADPFYHLDGHFGAVGKKPTSPLLRVELKEVLAEARVASKIMADPLKALKSDHENDRMLASWLLMTRYRTWSHDRAVEELIDASESKLILENLPLLAPKHYEAFGHALVTLDLTEADGFKGPVWTDDGKARAIKWVKDHAATYRIKKLVTKSK